MSTTLTPPNAFGFTAPAPASDDTFTVTDITHTPSPAEQQQAEIDALLTANEHLEHPELYLLLHRKYGSNVADRQMRRYLKEVCYFTSQEIASVLKEATELIRKPLTIGTDTEIEKILGPEEWIIEGWLPVGGKIMFIGLPKGGKSTICRQMAVDVSRGDGSFFGHKVTQTNILYLTLDEASRGTIRKARLAGHAEGDPRLKFNLERAMSLGSIRHVLKSNPDIKLVAIDLLSKVVRLGDAGQYGDNDRALQRLTDVIEEFGVAVAVVHHSNKASDGTNPELNANGSVSLTGWPDTIIEMKSIQDDKSVASIVSREDGKETPLLLQFHKDTQRYTIIGEHKSGTKSTKAEREVWEEAMRFYEHLTDSNKPMLMSDVYEWFDLALSRKKVAVDARIRELQKQGLVDKDKTKGHGSPYEVKVVKTESKPEQEKAEF